MYQRACGWPLAVGRRHLRRSILDPCWAVGGALRPRGRPSSSCCSCSPAASVRLTPAPAAQRSTPPPWSAPRDAISYITAAGLAPQPLNSKENSRVVDLRITVDGAPVEVPPVRGN